MAPFLNHANLYRRKNFDRSANKHRSVPGLTRSTFSRIVTNKGDITCSGSAGTPGMYVLQLYLQPATLLNTTNLVVRFINACYQHVLNTASLSRYHDTTPEK